LHLSTNAGDRYNQLAKSLLAYRDRNASGVVTNFGDLTQADGSGPAVVAALKEGYTLGPFAIRNTEIVGPKVGAELRKQAVYVTLYALGGMLLYIAFRFAGGGLLHIASSTWSWWNWFVGLFGVSLLLSGLVLLIMACLDWRSNGLLALISVVEFVASWFLRQFIQTWVDSSIFGLAAVLAVFHDVLITLGFFLVAALRDIADGHRRFAYAGRIFNERHDRDFRPDSRKQQVTSQTGPRRGGEQVH
jgi:hypothetical protein